MRRFVVGLTMSALTTSAHRITRYHVLVFIGCWLGGMFDGMDSTLMTVVLPSAIGDLVHSMAPEVIGHYGSLVGSAFLFGWMLGGVLIGMVGDRLGRIRSMILSITLYAVFTGLSGLSQTWWHLALCRFLTGLGIGGELVSITTFLAEVWPERSRAVAIGVLITSYQAGVLVAGTIVKFFPFWRTVFFIGALPAILTVLLRLTLRESERWMESKQLMREDYRLLGELFAPEHRRQSRRGCNCIRRLAHRLLGVTVVDPCVDSNVLSSNRGQHPARTGNDVAGISSSCWLHSRRLVGRSHGTGSDDCHQLRRMLLELSDPVYDQRPFQRSDLCRIGSAGLFHRPGAGDHVRVPA